MFVLQKSSFEQSLRSSITPTTPQKPGSGLKPEIHRGCTGKAHACGTLKSKILISRSISHDHSNHNGQGNNYRNNHRKSSFSSETISDSGSETSLWNSNELMVTTPTNAQRKFNSNSNGNLSISSTEASINGHHRKTPITIPPSIDEIDRSRTRLYSDGDKEEERLSVGLQRNRSFRVSKGSTTRPPWQSSLAKSAASNAVAKVNSFNRNYRSSMRRKSNLVDWNAIYQRSLFSSCSSGGLLKAFDGAINKKVG